MFISCSCGHMAPVDDFCRTPIGGELPHGSYQCPSCKIAWKVEPAGFATVTAAGQIIPSEWRIVAMQAAL